LTIVKPEGEKVLTPEHILIAVLGLETYKMLRELEDKKKNG
jgi:hypothetical protein